MRQDGIVRATLGGFLFVSALALTGCPQSTNDCEAYGTCTPLPPEDAGADSSTTPDSAGADSASESSVVAEGGKPDAAFDASAADVDAGCNVNAQPIDEVSNPADACVVSDAYGVFVAPGGTGVGTMSSPLGSVNA